MRGNGDDAAGMTGNDPGPAASTVASPLAAFGPEFQPAALLYARIEAAGFRYGLAARCLERIAVERTTARGTLVPTDALSPGHIEAAAQLAYAMLPPDAPPVMLAGADRLVRFAGGAPAAAWLHVTGISPEGGLRADLGLSDATGRVLFRLEGASFAPLPDHAGRWSRVVAWQTVPPPQATVQAPFVWRAPDGDPATLCAALLDLLPKVGERVLRIVTRGAQHVGSEAAPPNLGHAALWGMALAIVAERPALRCRLIDLDPDVPSDPVDAELGADDEPAVAWRGGRRLARHLEPPPRPLLAAEVATLASPGILHWMRREPTAPGPGMVRIGVVAAGLTFRDRLLFNGLAPAGSALGSDCAGVVEAVGAGVAGLREGDRVVVLAAEPIADTVMVPAGAVAPAPCADLIAAASMPVPYLTALAALPNLGPRDCVLVHQAASAAGLAAVAVARRAGARVVLTAGRQRHGWFAPEPVLDSRAPETWGDALADVTVAFGAFEPALAARLGGLPLVNLDKRAAWHFDLDRVDPAVKRGLMEQLADLPPLPRRVVPRADLAAALAGEGPLVGRTVVLLREPPPARIERGATYLVTGAAGALGRMVADWLAAAGAIVCRVDRVPLNAIPPHSAVQADAGDAAAMIAVLDRLTAGPSPLRGVFHCAAIVDDDRLEQQTADRLAAVMRAKVDGALVLDRLTRAIRLDHFVLFASVVGVLPSARQAGYAAANAVLDQIAQGRRQRGLPGLSLDWGPWHAGIGRAMGARAAEAWQGFGVTPIMPAAGLRALPALLAAPEPQRVVADMRWAQEDAPTPQAQPARPDPGPVTVARLQSVLAPLLGVRDPATLDADTPLLSFGLDSLSAVEFARALSRELGRPVAPDFVYNHPTLTQAAQALATRRPAAPRPSGFLLRAPHWVDAGTHRTVPRGWTVAGEGALAGTLRTTLATDPANLVDLTALDVDASADRPAREALFPGLLARLRDRLGRPAHIVLALPPHGALAGAVEGLATALAAEQPAWTLRTIRLDADLADPVAALVRELAADDAEPRLRLARHGRQVQRLVPVAAHGGWQASPDATWLVTGGSGGIGGRVAAHLVANGARHLVLAGRRPTLPPALAGSAAQVRLHPVDLGDATGVAALFADLRTAHPPLRGIFHAAGVTADGMLAATDWERMARAFPAKADGARLLDAASRGLDLTAFVLFSSTTAWFGLPGTAGYAAANGFLHGLAEERRAAGLPAVSIGWCAWQGVGMAADSALWQGGRVPSLPPDAALAALDAALGSGATSLVVTDPAWRPAGADRLLEHPEPAAAGARA
ncbi:MAG: SDR family NAD(P)-dependent oxidoreductase [Acetobacteraceae bacterium]|nr:SDR family NAD(P)-dependent oxidoreductase [Acetobacteraceae bacterium]